MSRTLVLNATYEPLGVVSDRRALILLLNQRAVMVEDSGTVLHYATGEVSLPSCLLYTSPSPRDGLLSRMPSSA